MGQEGKVGKSQEEVEKSEVSAWRGQTSGKENPKPQGEGDGLGMGWE